MRRLHLLLIISLLFNSTLLAYFLSFSSSRESRHIGQQLSARVICRILVFLPHPTICGPILGPIGMFFVRLFRTTYTSRLLLKYGFLKTDNITAKNKKN